MTITKSVPGLLMVAAGLTGCALLEDSTGSAVVKQAKPVQTQEIRPVPGEQVLTFLLAGDAGTGYAHQHRVAAGMAKVAREYPAGGVLYLGDNFYEFGVTSVSDSQWESAFTDVYADPALQIPFYSVLGNHDYILNEQAQVEYSARNPRWIMPDRYYTRTVAIQPGDSVRLIGLDTNLLLDETDTTQQLSWLDSVLTSSPVRYQVVFAHHPLYTGGEHGDNAVLQKMLSRRLEKAGVLLYATGHDHHLEVMDPQPTVWHVISGAAGKSRSVTWSARTRFAATNLGFMTLHLSDSRAWIQVYDADGNRLYSELLSTKMSGLRPF